MVEHGKGKVYSRKRQVKKPLTDTEENAPDSSMKLNKNRIFAPI